MKLIVEFLLFVFVIINIKIVYYSSAEERFSKYDIFDRYSSDKFRFIENCDLSSKTISNFSSPSLDACSNSCLENEKCKAFTFVSGWNRCFLKEAVGNQSTIRFYSGRIDTEEEGYDIDYIGNDLLSVPKLTKYEDCKKACKKEKACIAYGFIEGYNSCWLKDKVRKKLAKKFYCGIKNQIILEKHLENTSL